MIHLWSLIAFKHLHVILKLMLEVKESLSTMLLLGYILPSINNAQPGNNALIKGSTFILNPLFQVLRKGNGKLLTHELHRNFDNHGVNTICTISPVYEPQPIVQDPSTSRNGTANLFFAPTMASLFEKPIGTRCLGEG